MNNKILKNYLLGQKYFPARVWSLFPAAGPRVAKCQYFYTDQNCQTKFYPKKRVNCNSFDTNKKDTFGEQLLITLPILTSLYTQIVTKNGLILPTSVFFQTFTPTCQYFYTDISIISVTFRNSDNVQCHYCGWWGSPEVSRFQGEPSQEVISLLVLKVLRFEKENFLRN